MAPIEQTVRAFIATNFYLPNPSALAGDASLLDAGIMDSTGVLELTAFLEAELRISVRDDEIVADNLDTIERIVAFVARKRATLDDDSDQTAAQ